MLDNPDALLAYIDEAACLDRLADLVRHKSYSETEGERALAGHVFSILAELGLEAELQTVTNERVNAIGRLPGSGDGPSLLFNGHLDTNPATTGWTVDPWGGVIDDEFIYGIGVSNMKAGDAAYLCALETLLAAGVKLRGDVILSFVIGELQGGIGTVRMIEHGVRADYFVNAEPTDLRALTLHAGAFVFSIELTGDTRHLSKREEACDALAAAAALVPRLDALTFSGAETAAHHSVNRAHVGVLRAGLGDDFHEWRPPQVADRARLSGSCRYAPSQSIESVRQDLECVLDALALEFKGLRWVLNVHTEGQPSMPPFEVDPESRIVRAINTAHETVIGRAQETGPVRPPAFYGTDAAHLAAAGMQGVVCGPGGEFNTMPDERVRKREFLNAVRIYLLTMVSICGLADA